MAKFTQSTKLKGELDFDLSTETLYNSSGEQVEVLVLNSATITEVSKDDEKTFDLASVLDNYNGKSIALSISEDKDLEPIEE